MRLVSTRCRPTNGALRTGVRFPTSPPNVRVAKLANAWSLSLHGNSLWVQVPPLIPNTVRRIRCKPLLHETHIKGLLTEIQCVKDFVSLGIRCFQVSDQTAKYDVLVDTGKNKMIRIQCKTSSPLKSEYGDICGFKFNSSSISAHSGKSHGYSKRDIDFFYTYFQDKSYLIPVEDATQTRTFVRLEKTLNSQKQKIRYAKDYEFNKIISV